MLRHAGPAEFLAQNHQPASRPVAPQQIIVSSDRLAVEVQTAYPTNGGCAKEPGGLSIDVGDDLATISAIVENSAGTTTCTLECGHVWQSVTLDEPLPDPVTRRGRPPLRPASRVRR